MDYVLMILVILSLISCLLMIYAHYLYRACCKLFERLEDLLCEKDKKVKATLYSTGEFPRDVTNMTVEDARAIKDAMGIYGKEEGK